VISQCSAIVRDGAGSELSQATREHGLFDGRPTLAYSVLALV